jgi:hypothetical protein
MSVALKIVDQTVGVRPAFTRELHLVSERITLRELLKHRINEEVAELNEGGSETHPLVAPGERELRLNGQKPVRQMIDADKQLAAAIEAFERKRILIIADGRQVVDLDEPITVTSATEVRFLRLMPLVGG